MFNKEPLAVLWGRRKHWLREFGTLLPLTIWLPESYTNRSCESFQDDLLLCLIHDAISCMR